MDKVLSPSAPLYTPLLPTLDFPLLYAMMISTVQKVVLCVARWEAIFSPPPSVLKVLEQLEQNGWEAWTVGGCVRDSLLGKVPADWDVCTAALPETVQSLFEGQFPVIPTGLRHGTVTILADGMPVEVTTFRTEGTYTDHRRPDEVHFVTSLHQDLARRDFTVNAMAWSPIRGMRDDFGGQKDLEAGLLRCVGQPEHRFEEDALRMLRALRFCAQYGFTLEEETRRGIAARKELLKTVAGERVLTELKKLLTGPQAGRTLLDSLPVLGVVLPQLLPLEGFDQHNPHHHLDLWTHTCQVVDGCPREAEIRLAALFHDVAKPLCQSWGEDGNAHYIGHGAMSAEIARSCLNRLKSDGETVRQVTALVCHHDDPPPQTRKGVARLLGKLGPEMTGKLLALRRADILAQSPDTRTAKLSELERTQKLMEQLMEEQACLTISQLAVDGRMLMDWGIPAGPQLGKTLRWLLEQVLDGTVSNTPEALKQIWEEKNPFA